MSTKVTSALQQEYGVLSRLAVVIALVGVLTVLIQFSQSTDRLETVAQATVLPE